MYNIRGQKSQRPENYQPLACHLTSAFAETPQRACIVIFTRHFQIENVR